MKIVVNYLNFVFRIEVKTKSKYKILNFVFQFIKNTKWDFGCTNSLSVGFKMKPLKKALSCIKDTLKAFDDFRNKQQKCTK